MTHVLYCEPNLGCTERVQVLSSLFLVCCHFLFSGTLSEASTILELHIEDTLRLYNILYNIITE